MTRTSVNGCPPGAVKSPAEPFTSTGCANRANREKRVEVAIARGSEEGVDEFALAAEIGVGNRGHVLYPATCRGQRFEYHEQGDTERSRPADDHPASNTNRLSRLPVFAGLSKRRWWRAALRKVRTALAALVCDAALIVGCSTGSDAVVQGPQFSFVAPGGKTTILYDPPSTRGKVPEFSGESLMEPGKRIALSDFSGKVVVLNVWGSWCGPCRHEMPELQRVHEKTKADGVQLLGIDVRDHTREAPADFVANVGVTFPSIYDPPGRTLLALKGYPRNIVPSTIVLDRRHRVAAVFLKALLEEDLLPVVRRIAHEQPDKERR